MSADVSPEIPVSAGKIFSVWLAIGLQSFGGGTATLALVRRAVVQQHGWLSDTDFVRDWALCQVAPGINLLAVTILIGRRLGGMTGVLLALAGLLLPSAGITIAITACYVHFQSDPSVKAALHGVIPATVGLGLLTAGQMLVPQLSAARRDGRPTLLLSIGLLAASAFVVAAWHLPVVLVLCAVGGTSALIHWRLETKRAARNRNSL